MELNSRQRAYLKGLASTIDPIFQIGKGSLTPEITEAVSEAFNNRELIKIAVLKNCFVITKELLKIIINKNDCPLAVIFILKLSFY